MADDENIVVVHSQQGDGDGPAPADEPPAGNPPPNAPADDPPPDDPDNNGDPPDDDDPDDPNVMVKALLEFMQQQTKLFDLKLRETDAKTAAVEKKISTPSLRRYGVMQLTPFDGTTSWIEFENQVERYGKYLKWSDAEKAQQMCLSLREPASGVLMGLTSDQCEDYKTVRSTLKQHFCPAEKVFIYQAELRARKLHPGEDLDALAREILQKTSLAFPHTDMETKESLMQNYFCDSLTDRDMQLSVAKSHPRTLAQALAFAVEYSSIMEADSQAQERKPTRIRQVKMEDEGDEELHQDSSKAASTFQKQLDTLQISMKTILDKLKSRDGRDNRFGRRRDRNRPRQPKEEVVCFNCDKKGHYARECAEPKRPRQNSDRPKQPEKKKASEKA